MEETNASINQIKPNGNGYKAKKIIIIDRRIQKMQEIEKSLFHRNKLKSEKVKQCGFDKAFDFWDDNQLYVLGKYTFKCIYIIITIFEQKG